MGIARGPNIVRSGLITGYDNGYHPNVHNSYKGRFYGGEPTINVVGGITKQFGNWSGLTGKTEYYRTKEGNQGVKLDTYTSGGVNWYSFDRVDGISANTSYSISATVKYNTLVNPHPNLLYVRQYNSSNTQTSEVGRFSTSKIEDLGDGWKRVYNTFTTTSTTSKITLQGYEYSANRTIFIQDIQLEQKGHHTPFAGDNTTRSNTQCLIDLKRNISLDVSNVTFDSNARFSFNGSSDHIQLGASSIFNLTRYVTIEAVVKRDSAGWNGIFGNNNGGSFIHFQLYGETVNVYYYGPNLAIVSGNVITSTSNYYHIATTFDGSTAKIYVNGAEVTSATTTSTSNLSAASTVSVGKVYSSDRHFDGEIPLFKLYNRALEASEVATNYNACKDRFNI